MASVSDVSLQISPNSLANTQTVTVSGTLNFEEAEVGKSYRLEIKIFGEDKPGDNVPPNDPIGDNELYAFLWGHFFRKIPYKPFMVNMAGKQNFTERRAISDETLDEDSGKVIVGWADINTPVFMPRADEIYAKVVLSSLPSTGRSNTVKTAGV
jgi:hypothetical protein